LPRDQLTDPVSSNAVTESLGIDSADTTSGVTDTRTSSYDQSKDPSGNAGNRHDDSRDPGLGGGTGEAVRLEKMSRSVLDSARKTRPR
jgi:hypothetical protein